MSFRVLMTSDTVGGVRGYSLDLCRAISAAGGEVLLVTMGPRGGQAFLSEVREIPRVTLVGTDYKLEWMDEPWSDVRRAGELLLEFEAKFLPDVVHLNGFCHGALPLRAPKLVVAHSCVLSWWEAVLREPAPAKYDEYRSKVRAGLMGADVVVAPTHAMREALERHYGPLARSLVLRNGARSDYFVPGFKQPSMCAVGRFWDQAKNLDVVVEAARGLSVPLYVAGDLTPPEGVAGRPAHLAGENVHMLGLLSDSELAELLSRSAIMVHAARYEPFGLAVLEAGLSGCALVLSDLPSLRELWEGAALFVPVDDVGALRQTLAELSQRPAQQAQLGQRARERALGYSLSMFGRAYLELYERTCAERRSGSQAGSGSRTRGEPLDLS